MGQISKKNVAGIIGNYDDDTETRYCIRCLEYGLYKILQERVYKPAKPNEPKQPLPRDHDDWLQCHNCGKVYAKYEVKTEDKLNDFAEINDNRHDVGGVVLGIGNKKKKTDIQKQHDILLKQIDAEQDPDIKQELRKGNVVEYDSGNYFEWYQSYSIITSTVTFNGFLNKHVKIHKVINEKWIFLS